MAMLTPSARSGKAKHFFTYEEDVIIVKMTQEGYPARAIAEALGTHSELAIRYRQQWHRKPTTPATLEDLKAYHKAQANKRNKVKPIMAAPAPAAPVEDDGEAINAIIEDDVDAPTEEGGEEDGQ